MDNTRVNKDRRRVWFFLPLALLPFLALGFYAMGGGSGKQALGEEKSAGINTSLPDASFSGDTLATKADYYDQAERLGTMEPADGLMGIAGKLGFSDLEGKGDRVQAQTAAIDDQLAAIQKEVDRVEPAPFKRKVSAARGSSEISADVDRLEGLMKTMQENKGQDPEMAQLNELMQGILDIQHPGRVAQRQQLRESLLPDSQFKATPAQLISGGKVMQGATVRLELSDSLRIGELLVPKGNALFGACRISNQRILIDVKNIRLGTSIIPVDLSVYGLDGMVGLSAPEAVLGDALNSGAGNAVRGLGIGGFDSSVGMQVAGAGIDAAREMISRRVRKLKVRLHAGTAVLLRNNQSRGLR